MNERGIDLSRVEESRLRTRERGMEDARSWTAPRERREGGGEEESRIAPCDDVTWREETVRFTQ